tara:strand:- start:78 stop:227 length:150 start_codon:yes stop_codon:yes gene_type:complete
MWVIPPPKERLFDDITAPKRGNRGQIASKVARKRDGMKKRSRRARNTEH